jgi:NADH:ubiquinone reductase (H+-translocating)
MESQIAENNNRAHTRPRVVIIGAGFGGLTAAKSLADAPVDTILIDRDNYHLFTPLLYQVAGAEIASNEISYPVRKILQKVGNAQFMLGNVREIDFKSQQVKTDNIELHYDYLIISTGSRSHFFNIPGAAENSYPLKNLETAITLRNRILDSFERAAYESDSEARKRLLTFVIVGGGPTGVEFAGALSELVYGPLKRDYKTIDFNEVRIILVEAADSLLGTMLKRLRDYTKNRLQKMNVEVRLNSVVNRIEKDAIYLKDGGSIASQTIIWTAGVQGDPSAKYWGLPVGRGGTIEVQVTMQAPNMQNVYIIGDIALVRENGKPLPMVAPVAMQEGTAAAQNIVRQIRGEKLAPFKYSDQGSLAVIGRNAAVADFGWLKLTGYPAWLLWLVIHLFKLIGFKNRLLVMINWAWDYLFFERTLRVIMPRERKFDDRHLSEAPSSARKQQIEIT